MEPSKKRYRVRLRKVYRDEHSGFIVSAHSVRSFETAAVSDRQAENNARHRFGPDGHQRNWKSVGFGEQMRVELVECTQI